MKEYSIYDSPERRNERGYNFREAVINAQYSHNRSIPIYISELNIGGPVNEIAQQLLSETIQDPQHNMRLKPTYTISPKRGLIIPDHTFVGDQGVIENDLDDLNAKVDEDYPYGILAGTIWSSYSSFYPTPIDMADLLMKEKEGITSTAFELRVDPYETIAIFRGPNTPQLSLEESSEQTKVWQELMHSESSKFEPYGRSFASKSLVDAHNARKKVFMDFTRKYGLRVFKKRIDKNILFLENS